MFSMPALRRSATRLGDVSPVVIGLAAIVATWVVLGIARTAQPGYVAMRDTISSLASHGASFPWIGMAGIAIAGIATVMASFPLRRLSQPAALAMGVAGFALLVVAFTRIACPDGAAGCSMGGATDPATSTAHLAAIMVFEVTFVTAIGSAAICLWRSGARIASLGAIVGMVLSIVFVALAPMEVGMKQRLWLLVNSLLLVGCQLLPFRGVGHDRQTDLLTRHRSQPRVSGEA
jgi:hypothetical protein